MLGCCLGGGLLLYWRWTIALGGDYCFIIRDYRSKGGITALLDRGYCLIRRLYPGTALLDGATALLEGATALLEGILPG